MEKILRDRSNRFAYISPEEMLGNIKLNIEILSHRVGTQKSSYDTLERLVKSKEENAEIYTCHSTRV